MSYRRHGGHCDLHDVHCTSEVVRESWRSGMTCCSSCRAVKFRRRQRSADGSPRKSLKLMSAGLCCGRRIQGLIIAFYGFEVMPPPSPRFASSPSLSCILFSTLDVASPRSFLPPTLFYGLPPTLQTQRYLIIGKAISRRFPANLFTSRRRWKTAGACHGPRSIEADLSTG